MSRLVDLVWVVLQAGIAYVSVLATTDDPKLAWAAGIVALHVWAAADYVVGRVKRP